MDAPGILGGRRSPVAPVASHCPLYGMRKARPWMRPASLAGGARPSHRLPVTAPCADNRPSTHRPQAPPLARSRWSIRESSFRVWMLSQRPTRSRPRSNAWLTDARIINPNLRAFGFAYAPQRSRPRRISKNFALGEDRLGPRGSLDLKHRDRLTQRFGLLGERLRGG